MSHTDILIIGGSLAGATLALALSRTGYKITLLEMRPDASNALSDPRSLALSYGSILFLKKLGIWTNHLEHHAEAMNIVEIRQAPNAVTYLNKDDYNYEMLGGVTHFGAVHQAVMNALKNSPHVKFQYNAKVTQIHESDKYVLVEYQNHNQEKNQQISARRVILADGGQSASELLKINYKIYDYNQIGLLATLETENIPKNHAYEYFTEYGPIALLPLGDTKTHLVWTMSPEALEQLDISKSDDLIKLLTSRLKKFNNFHGKIKAIQDIATYPLKAKLAEKITSKNCILISNSAQTLHPVAGQGFNLGLRDIATLSDLIIRHGLEHQYLTQHYQHARQLDRKVLFNFTNGLVKVFSNDFLPLKIGRSHALNLLNFLPPVKQFVTNHMIFGLR